MTRPRAKRIVRRTQESSMGAVKNRAGMSIAQVHAKVRKKALAMLWPSRNCRTTVPARARTTERTAALSNEPHNSATWPRTGTADGAGALSGGPAATATGGGIGSVAARLVATGVGGAPATATSRAMSAIVR